MENTYIEILKLLIPTLLGGVIGYFLKYYLEKKQEIETAIYTQKRDMYKEFVSIIVGLITGSKDIDPESKEYKKHVEKSIEKLYEFYKSYLMYSSPTFINAFGDFMQYTYTQEQNTKKMTDLLAKVIKALRDEVGLSNKGLGKNGENIYKAIFKDFSKIYDK